MTSGIYTITNLVNNKMYVGLATNITIRWREHKSELRGDYHGNIKLQRAWNKYGEKAFKFEILWECEERFLYSEEHYWCNLLNVHNGRYGYNIKPTHPDNKSRMTEETKKKISKALIGRKLSKEACKNMSEANKGRVFTEEHLLSLKIACSTQEHRDKLSIALKGKKKPERSREHAQKIGDRNKGRIMTDDQKKHLSEYNKGKVFSEEWKQNISKAAKNRKSQSTGNRTTVISYNEDVSVYQKFLSFKEALHHFDRKHSEIWLLSRAIKKGNLVLGKYWKYEDKDNKGPRYYKGTYSK